MGHHLMIDKLVALGGLYYAIQRHYATKCSVLKNNQILVIGLFIDTERYLPQSTAQTGRVAFHATVFFRPWVDTSFVNTRKKRAQHNS